MESLPRQIKKFITLMVVLLIVALLIENPAGSSFVTSLTNQEFVLAHLKDIEEHIDHNDEESGFYLSTGSYEKEKDGPLFGIAENRNLIIVQLESIQELMVEEDYHGQEIMPFINELRADPSSIYFDNFYCQIGAGNTSDAEFAVNNSIIGSVESYTYQLYQDNFFKGLPVILKEKGYSTNVFHGYKRAFWNRENIYPNLGFDRFFSGEDFVSDNIKGIGAGNIVGISDSEFYRQTADYMEELPQPFYGFAISLSSHNPFGLPPYLQEIELEPEDENIVGRYIQSVNYADRCLREFFDHLKEKGLYDNSIIVIYGDHFGLTASDPAVKDVVENWIGREYTYDTMMRIPCLIHIPGENVGRTVSISGGQADIMPTVAYLLGLDNLDTLYVGHNMLTADSGFAAFQMNMLKGSFVKDDVVFEMSRDGVYENSRVRNRLTGEELDPEPYYDDYMHAKQIIDLSHFYLDNDVIRLAIAEDKDMDEISREIHGEKQLAKELCGYDVSACDKADIDRVYKEISQNIKKDKGFYAAVASDDPYGLFSYIEETYSGKTGRKGSILKIDKDINKDYVNFMKHVYPVCDMSSATKTEYLGYENIIIKPETGKTNVATLNDFIQMNVPAGILLDKDTSAAFSCGIEKGKSMIYYLSSGSMEERMYAKIHGADGFVY